jgi:hypothetical protein
MLAKVRCALLALAVLLPALAQEGFPLNGSWHGDWGAPGGARTPVLIYMHWDSKNITGTINPGPKGAPLKVATLDPSKWAVHLEADTKDGQHIVADGKIDNLGSYNRTLSGSWTQGSVKGDFKVTRD